MQRIKELDSIRGLASLSIVDYHLWLARIGLMCAAVGPLNLVRLLIGLSTSKANAS
jgi:hypothetical protein